MGPNAHVITNINIGQGDKLCWIPADLSLSFSLISGSSFGDVCAVAVFISFKKVNVKDSQVPERVMALDEGQKDQKAEKSYGLHFQDCLPYFFWGVFL